MDHERALRLLRDALPQLQAVYQFGSSVTEGEHSHPESDLDLGVLSPAPLTPAVRWELQERLASLYGQNVDLVDLRGASTVMRKEVIAGGQLLFDGAPSSRALFEATTLAAYARLNEERKAILQDIRERGTVHG